VGALLIALVPLFWSVMSAQVLIGDTPSIFGPSICAVSLGIVGHQLIDRRQGRNETFNSAGNVVAAVSKRQLGYFASIGMLLITYCASPEILNGIGIRSSCFPAGCFGKLTITWWPSSDSVVAPWTICACSSRPAKWERLTWK
jgi:hypothetical protein